MLKIVGSSSAPELEHALDRRRRACRPGAPATSVAVEAVDAGRHRGVRGEHRAGAHRLQRLVEAETVVLDELADALDTEEARVALVGVEHLGRRRAGDLAVGADGAHAADAEQQFLLEPVLAPAAVEPVGDLPGRECRSPRCRCRAAAAAPGRPLATQTWACSVRPSGSAIAIRTGAPSASLSARIGRPPGSSDG